MPAGKYQRRGKRLFSEGTGLGFQLTADGLRVQREAEKFAKRMHTAMKSVDRADLELTLQKGISLGCAVRRIDESLKK